MFFFVKDLSLFVFIYHLKLVHFSVFLLKIVMLFISYFLCNEMYTFFELASIFYIFRFYFNFIFVILLCAIAIYYIFLGFHLDVFQF